MNLSLKNHASAGLLIGVALMALFAIGVVFLHGCEGSGCGWRGASTVISHALLGAIAGAIVGSIVFFVRKRSEAQ
jgi:hypothetical protein